MRTVLVVRLDSAGDVLLAGPAVRAVAAQADRVVLLAGPRGRDAAALLPGVNRVVEWRCPWIDPEPDPVGDSGVLSAAAMIRGLDASEAVIFTSFHQDPLPTALLLRLAGVPRVTAACDDYPGSLVDVRHRLPADGLHEVERMLSVAAAAGFPPPADTALRLRAPHPRVPGPVGPAGYIVVHPGASVPARSASPGRCAEHARALAGRGWRVVVTGTRAERPLTRAVAGEWALDLGGQTGLAAMVSEHASPLAVLGGTDAGGQNAHVAALAAGIADRGAEVVVHTRRDDRNRSRRVRMAPGVTVDHVPAGPAEPARPAQGHRQPDHRARQRAGRGAAHRRRPGPGVAADRHRGRRPRALASGHGIGHRVRFLGRVGRAELPALYRSADVVASVPWYEPFGIVPVEAMACGVPVVAAAVGGLADTVIDNVTGLHGPPRDPGRIAAALRRLLADQELRRSFGAAGRERAVRHYAMDRVVAGTLRAYAATARAVTTMPGMRA